MPPYALPDNQTMTGIKTNKSKKGDGFNEFVMEDRAGAEYVRLQSERDYKAIIKNDAVVTIGLEHKDKGDLTQTIHRNKTETLKTGDHTLTIEAGNQVISTKRNRTERIEGNSDLKLTGNLTEDVGGNHSEKVGGNATLIANGNIKIEALGTIEIKTGGSTIKLTPASIEIKSPMIAVEASGTAKLSAPMTNVEAAAILILKGGMTLIN